MESPFHLFSGGNEDSDWTGFLEAGSRLEGTLVVPGTFRLDGALTGKILSRRLLVLGRTAEVEGEIEAERVLIYGRFRGTLRASGQVEIQSGATVSGDIYTPCLLLQPGGRFDGHCYLNPAGATADPLLVHVRANSAAEADQIVPGSQVI
ncbi:MAG TPA: polymer-forming cytoskeletal protein [Candidatus Dormibacteraeota bacterium]|nr:polymer-forming cytoskeletal protein [Candidatus Dormibacteraeota bacterium]